MSYYDNQSQSALTPCFLFSYTNRLSLYTLFLCLNVHNTIFNRVCDSYLQKLQKHPTFNISPSGISAATMRMQETDNDQPSTGFPASKPTMDGSLSSRYGNPLTFKVVVMFLFYVLGITLCLSRVSTCVCVIFNPIVLSLLLTFLTVPLIGLYFDSLAEPKSQTPTEVGKEKPIPKPQYEKSAPEAIINPLPTQEEHPATSPTRKLQEPTLTEEPFHKVLAPLVHEAECEKPRRASPVDAPATPKYRPVKPHELTANPTASDTRVLIPRLQQVAHSKILSGTDERIKKHFFKTTDAAASSTEHATQLTVNAATHIAERAAPAHQDSTTMSTEEPTTRESKMMANRTIIRTKFPPPITTTTTTATETNDTDDTHSLKTIRHRTRRNLNDDNSSSSSSRSELSPRSLFPSRL